MTKTYQKTMLNDKKRPDMSQNDWKWLKTTLNAQKQHKWLKSTKWRKWSKMTKNDRKQQIMTQNYSRWPKMTKNDAKKQSVTDQPTDGPTDRPTDGAGCRVACTRLKSYRWCPCFFMKLIQSESWKEAKKLQKRNPATSMRSATRHTAS